MGMVLYKHNGNERGYPWKISINSMLGFCDEVVVIDGGSNDGTWEELQQMANNNNKLKISQHVVDWDYANRDWSDCTIYRSDSHRGYQPTALRYQRDSRFSYCSVIRFGRVYV